jgi:hypothetical protein
MKSMPVSPKTRRWVLSAALLTLLPLPLVGCGESNEKAALEGVTPGKVDEQAAKEATPETPKGYPGASRK